MARQKWKIGGGNPAKLASPKLGGRSKLFSPQKDMGGARDNSPMIDADNDWRYVVDIYCTVHQLFHGLGLPQPNHSFLIEQDWR